VRLTLVTHSTVAVATGSGVLLTDPVLRGRVAFLRRTTPPPDPAVLHDVRAVLISHLHHDHCDLPSLARLGRSTMLLVPAGTQDFFRRHGFTDVWPLRPGDRHSVLGFEVAATPAAHDGTRRPFGSPSSAIGYVVTADAVTAYFAGDTDLFDGMRDLAGDLDVALLPVAGWGRTLGPGHLDPARAAQAVGLLAPSVAVPIHWDGLRPFWHATRTTIEAGAAPRAFAAEVARLGLPAQVEVVSPGRSIEVEPAPGRPRRT